MPVFFFVIMKKFGFKNCPSKFKPVIYRRYVDDTFLLFRSKHHIEKFRNYLNRQHKNIKFTSETENKNSMSFLDIKITRNDNKFMTSVYRKLSFSGVFTNFVRFIPNSYNYNLLFTLLQAIFKTRIRRMRRTQRIQRTWRIRWIQRIWRIRILIRI